MTEREAKRILKGLSYEEKLKLLVLMRQNRRERKQAAGRGEGKEENT